MNEVRTSWAVARSSKAIGGLAAASAFNSFVHLHPALVIARYGGEEIVMLLPGSDVAGAVSVAAGARQAVAYASIGHADNAVGLVTVSLGVAALIVEPGRSAAELLQLADDALYEAKRAGRNRVAANARCGNPDALALEERTAARALVGG